MALVDSLDEQAVLERLLDESEPPVPAAARRLHYLLFTPFRYPPPPGGSRFRAGDDPGVFYAAEAISTACAELGYWRWRHLADSPALSAMPARAQTVFKVKVAGSAVDLRERPFVRDAGAWTAPNDYGACQRFAKAARQAPVQVIRYQSVRDPAHGGCAAVLAPAAFARSAPVAQQTWMLGVFRERVVWQHMHGAHAEAFEFRTEQWQGTLPKRHAGPRSPRKP